MCSASVTQFLVTEKKNGGGWCHSTLLSFSIEEAGPKGEYLFVLTEPWVWPTNNPTTINAIILVCGNRESTVVFIGAGWKHSEVGNKIYHHIVIQLHSCHPSLVCSGAIYCVGQLLAHMAMTCRVPTVIHDHKPSIHVAPAHPLRTEQPIGRKRRKKENQSKMATGVSVLLTSH